VRITAFRVINYKSFADSRKLRFEPGFNVIVGRNNVGKTALAEAVSLHFLVDKPHRSLRTIPRQGAPHDSSSRAEVSIWVEANELANLLADEVLSFSAPTNPDRTDAGEAWLQTALSEGVTVEVALTTGA